MDHKQTSAQDQTSNERCEDGQKRLNYYLRVHHNKLQGSAGKLCDSLGRQYRIHTPQVTLTHRSTEGRSWHSTEYIQILDKTQVQWASNSNSLQMSLAGELHPCRVHWQGHHPVWPVQLPQWSLWMTTKRCNFNWYFCPERHTSSALKKGSNLTLNQAIEIAQNEEATWSQMSFIWT